MKNNPELLKMSYFFVSDMVRKEAQEEAIKIIDNATDFEREEFVSNSETGEGNVSMLVLDFIKSRLVKEGIMAQNKNDYFGKQL